MSTYSDLRTDVLTALDQTGDTGDIKSLVDATMKMVLDELIVMSRPYSLLNEAMKNIGSSATSIDIVADFGVALANFEKPLCLSVDYKNNTTRTDVVWEFVPYIAWLKMNDAVFGLARGVRKWTITPSSTVVLSDWPQSGKTWDVYLNYYKPTAAVADNGVPEIPAIHHQAIFYGTVVRFPHFFQGERAPLLQMYVGLWEQAKVRYMADRDLAFRRLKIKLRAARSPQGLLWGDPPTP